MYPDILTKTIDSFKKFNGIGEKTAERLALSVLEMTDEEVENLASELIKLKNSIVKCKVCGHITDDELCNICKDKLRDDHIICVVEDYNSVIKFQKTENYNGKFHVLNGVISPIDGITPDDLNISSLIERLKSTSGSKEVIIALKPSIEGETTTLYLKKILEEFDDIKITRLSYGIPVGVEIDYLDSMTLDMALRDRKDI